MHPLVPPFYYLGYPDLLLKIRIIIYKFPHGEYFYSRNHKFFFFIR